MSELIKTFIVKATKNEGDEIRRSFNWALARRGTLKIYDDHLECGDWSIKYSDFREAVVFSFRSPLFIPGYILRVKTDADIYQFGLNPGSFWKGELPFEAKREKQKLKNSTYSIVVRLLLLGGILYWLWGKYLT
jgi:hypothetical protein